MRSVTCHMGSHSVTYHQTQVNAPRLNPSQAGRYPINLTTKNDKYLKYKKSKNKPLREAACERSRHELETHLALDRKVVTRDAVKR